MFAKKLNKVSFAFNGLIAALGSLASVSTQAAIYGGVDFPGGASSFADAVVTYDPTLGGASGPQASARDPLQALGIPTGDPNYGFVTLGDGGQITLRFTNNSLTGSGSSALDLWIFEVGPDVEDTFVDISKDGANWFSVGKVAGATAGIDIDAYGFGTSDFFSYVRLTDDTDEGEQGNGQTVGADIDAVGAISSAPPVNQVPEPTTLALLGVALAIAGMRGRPASR